MVAGFDISPGGRGLHEGNDAAAAGLEPPFLPARLPVLHIRDRLLTAGHRVGRQSTDHSSQRHAAHARRRRYRHRLARQLAGHVPLAPR